MIRPTVAAIVHTLRPAIEIGLIRFLHIQYEIVRLVNQDLV
jgi:hypothetical protein